MYKYTNTVVVKFYKYSTSATSCFLFMYVVLFTAVDLLKWKTQGIFSLRVRLVQVRIFQVLQPETGYLRVGVS